MKKLSKLPKQHAKFQVNIGNIGNTELAQFLMEREKKLSPAAHQFTAQRTSSLLSAQVFEFSKNKKIVKYAYAMEKKKHGN